MASLPIIRNDQVDFEKKWQRFCRQLSIEADLLDDRARLDRVREIIEEVRSGGDQALAQLTSQLDKVDLAPEQFRIGPEELQAAYDQADPALIDALGQAIINVRKYQEAIKIQPRHDWRVNGVQLGVRYRPLNRVAVCVPGASAPLVSTVIMTVVPAQVAGVKEIVVLSPPSCSGSINPDVLAVCLMLEVNEIYRVFGAQAVAAAALGTDTIRRVDMVVGPSNAWAQLAKKELFGLINMDSFAGPSDVLILADDSAKPEWVAADMLSQAEHAPGSAVLVTDSAALADAVAEQIDIQLDELSRAEQTRTYVAESSLAVVARDMSHAIHLANEFAPEHLQVQTHNSGEDAERVINAGAVFIGPYTPVACGDYFAGPSHVLPVGGAARIFGPLNVNDFLKQSSVVSYDDEALDDAAQAIDTIARAEGLDAHARSVTRRVES